MRTSERGTRTAVVTTAFALALVVAAVAATGRVPPHAAPVVRAAAESGTLHVSNSTDGTALLTAADMRPGATATAATTFTNDGDVPALLELSLDRGAAPLAAALQWSVADFAGVVHQLDAPVTIGRLAPGDSRSVVVSATLPQSAGNDLQGATGSADLRWTASAAAGVLGVERRAPQLRVGRFTWALGRHGAAVIVNAGCTEVLCRVRDWGWISVGRKRVAWGMRSGGGTAGTAGGMVRARIWTSARAFKVLARAACRRRRVTAVVFARVSAPDGTSWLVHRRVRVPRRSLSRATLIYTTSVRYCPASAIRELSFGRGIGRRSNAAGRDPR